MRWSLLILKLTLLLFMSCKNSKSLNIYYENGSDINSEVIIETFLEDNLIDNRTVRRGDTLIHWELLSIKLPKSDDSIRLRFKVPETNYNSECTISKSQISSKTWLHVALKEVVFKKGDRIPGKILEKDSIMERKFYCELVNTPR